MSSSDNPEVTETEVREKGHKEEEKEGGHKEEEKEGFIEKVKDFIHDIGEKIEEVIGFGKPTADVTGVHLPTINLKKVDIIVDVLIKNPNPIPIPLIDINYLIDSEGRKLVSGLIPDAGTIHAHGSETVKIPVTLIFDDIKSTYHEIKPGSIIPYRIKVDLIVDIPIFGRITLPLEKKGEIPIPYKPDVDVEKIRFAKFSLEETVADLHLKLENKNDFDLGLNMLDYELWLSDESIASAELTQSIKIEKQGVCRMKIPITFRPKDFGSAIWDMIRGRGTGYTIKGNIDVDTPFGNMKLPISKVGGTTKLRKNRGGEDDGDSDSLRCLKRRANSYAFQDFVQLRCFPCRWCSRRQQATPKFRAARVGIKYCRRFASEQLKKSVSASLRQDIQSEFRRRSSLSSVQTFNQSFGDEEDSMFGDEADGDGADDDEIRVQAGGTKMIRYHRRAELANTCVM